MREAQPLVQVGPRGSPPSSRALPNRTALHTALISAAEGKQARKTHRLLGFDTKSLDSPPPFAVSASSGPVPAAPSCYGSALGSHFTSLPPSPVPAQLLSHPRFAQTAPSLPRCLHLRDPKQGVRALPPSSIKALLRVPGLQLC